MADTSSARPFEPTDANPRLVAALGAGLAVFIIGTPFALMLFYPPDTDPAAKRPSIEAAAPNLQIDPPLDLAVMRQAEDARLSSYGRDTGGIHIPIDHAMDVIAGRGLPGWTK